MKKLLLLTAFGLWTAAGAALAQCPWGNGPGYGPGPGMRGQICGGPTVCPGPRGPGLFRHQGARDPAAHLARKVERLALGLNLDAAQKAQVQRILEEQQARRLTQRQETHERILAVLHPSQRVQARPFLNPGRSGCPGPGPGFGRGGRGPGPGACFLPPPSPTGPEILN